MKLFFTIIIISWSISASLAQNNNEVLEITGRLLRMDTHKPIRNANILNLKKKQITASDTAGYFYITLLRSDIIRFSAIGYETEYVSFTDSVVFSAKIMQIYLLPKSYNIAEVDIYKARWDDFKFEFEHIGIEEHPGQDRLQKWFLTFVDPEEIKMITAANSIGIPIHFKNNREKQTIKLNKVIVHDKLDALIESRYNKEIVGEITGYEGEKLDKFITFSNLSSAEILFLNEYDIIVRIIKNKKRFEHSQRLGF